MTIFTKSFVSGCTLFGLAAAGAMGTINVNLVQCLVFSGLIVAVDPVAVSSLHLPLTNHTISAFWHLIYLKSVVGPLQIRDATVTDCHRVARIWVPLIPMTNVYDKHSLRHNPIKLQFQFNAWNVITFEMYEQAYTLKNSAQSRKHLYNKLNK